MSSSGNQQKYEITDKSRPYILGDMEGTLNRIRAVKDFGYVHAGDFGGWIEKEENLSQTGEAWVFANSVVIGDARVQDDAIIKDSCLVADHALIKDRAELDNGSAAYGNAVIGGDARLLESAVFDNAVVVGDIGLKFRITVGGNARLTFGMPHIGPYAINGPAYIGSDACIGSYYDCILLGPITRLGNRHICVYRDKVRGIAISVGCSAYSLSEFCKQEAEGDASVISECARRAIAETARWMFQ